MGINYEEVGRRIRDRRVAMGMSQEALAEQADLSPAYISHIERGVKGPGLSALIRLAAALETTIDYLLAGSQPTDQTAFLDDIQMLLGDCSLTERWIVLQVASTTKTALRQAGVAT